LPFFFKKGKYQAVHQSQKSSCFATERWSLIV